MPRDETSPARERPEGQPLDRFDRIRYQDLSDEECVPTPARRDSIQADDLTSVR